MHFRKEESPAYLQPAFPHNIQSTLSEDRNDLGMSESRYSPDASLNDWTVVLRSRTKIPITRTAIAHCEQHSLPAIRSLVAVVFLLVPLSAGAQTISSQVTTAPLSTQDSPAPQDGSAAGNAQSQSGQSGQSDQTRPPQGGATSASKQTSITNGPNDWVHRWLRTVGHTKELQPHYAAPLITAHVLLVQQFRYDSYWQSARVKQNCRPPLTRPAAKGRKISFTSRDQLSLREIQQMRRVFAVFCVVAISAAAASAAGEDGLVATSLPAWDNVGYFTLGSLNHVDGSGTPRSVIFLGSTSTPCAQDVNMSVYWRAKHLPAEFQFPVP